eukprot:gnl/MRDRNA2_/MRDRNA2_127566_c0_seq1.p1 gnl/MRDRNA2_/MRDRNA2_127566_c0~~gnl/MRDRNA2_/MRDRNA2_127566_c0_seq1.p1  ORF type:complete len:462 (-),score=62.10 gnl/MRDRNA2_/MRDRNA2_127566_c0_seq1:135-1520(-)
MGCGASKNTGGQVLDAKRAEEERLAPLLMRMEEIAKLHREGLTTDSEFNELRRALLAEIAGTSSLTPTVSAQKQARIRKADELRRQAFELERQMAFAPDKLPNQYFEVAKSLPSKFTTEVPEQVEWRHAGTGLMQEYYNGIAGRTIDEILKDTRTTVDENQNPVGTEYDLPRDGTMQEHTLLICWFADEGTYSMPVKALERKGFKVIVHNYKSSTVQRMMVSLLSADVVWLISGQQTSKAFEELLESLELFHRRGGGIFVWGDNAPYFAHANKLLSTLFPGESIYLEGNDLGKQIMRAHSDGLSAGHLTRHHLIMTGLYSLYEGNTISYLARTGPLKVLATYNDGPGYQGKPYCAIADTEVYRRSKAPGLNKGRGRVVIDGGFTKLYDEYWHKTSGTERYVLNATTWLLNMNSRIVSEEDAPSKPAKAHFEDELLLPGRNRAPLNPLAQIRIPQKSYRMSR